MAMKAPSEIVEWSGEELLAQRFEREGFKLPRRFIEFTAPLVGETQRRWRTELLRYARDFVRCSGKVPGEVPAKDRLGFVRRELVMNHEVRDRYVSLQRKWLGAETTPDPSLAKDWSERRVQLRAIAQRAAVQAGFQKTATGYSVPVSGSMRLEVEVDTGRRGSTALQFVTYNRLRAARGGWEMWLPWDEVLPGMFGYKMEPSKTALVWSIKAHVAAAKAFASTFE